MELPKPINNLSDDNIQYYEKWHDQLSKYPEWLESASERLMAILVRGGSLLEHIKDSFNVLLKESALNESREFLLPIYHIERRRPFTATHPYNTPVQNPFSTYPDDCLHH